MQPWTNHLSLVTDIENETGIFLERFQNCTWQETTNQFFLALALHKQPTLTILTILIASIVKMSQTKTQTITLSPEEERLIRSSSEFFPEPPSLAERFSTVGITDLEPFPSTPARVSTGIPSGTTPPPLESSNPLTDSDFRRRVELAMQKNCISLPGPGRGSGVVNVLLSIVPDSTLDVQTIQTVGKDARCRIRFTYLGRNADGAVVNRKILASAFDRKVQCAVNTAKDNLLDKLYPPLTQSDEGTIHGDQEQGADVAANTIVTHDAGTTDVADIPIPIPKAVSICSTERIHHFPSITDRWMALATISVDTTNTGRLAQWLIPQDLYRRTHNSVNMLPFETFLYCKLDVEFKFMVNSSQFNSGKLIAFIVHDPVGLEPNYLDNTPTATTRPHVILDLSTNTEGNLLTSQRYRRTFTRTKEDASRTGHPVRVALQSALNLHVLSPLTAAASQPSSIDITIFFRFSDNNYAGMTWRDSTPISYQMDTLGEMATGALAGGIKPLVVKAEQLIRQIGNPGNTDKPIDLDSTIIVPRPRKGFYTARGVSGAMPLRHCADGTTTVHPELSSNDPIDLLQIGQLWSLSDRFNWSVSNNARGTLLYNVTPTIGSGRYMTTADYVGLMYSYFSGTFDYRFDFVSTGFHQGSVTISAEFGSNPTDTTTTVATQSDKQFSTYHATFHLGAQKSFEFTVPYIYDTAYRRRPHPLLPPPYKSDGTFKEPNELNMDMATKLIVRVCNPLVPITNVTQSIEVLVYKRLGQNFGFHSPCSMGALLRSRNNTSSDNKYAIFPDTTVWPEKTTTAALNATASGRRPKPTILRVDNSIYEKVKPYFGTGTEFVDPSTWTRWTDGTRARFISYGPETVKYLTAGQWKDYWNKQSAGEKEELIKEGYPPATQMMEDEEVAAPTFSGSPAITRFYQASDANTNIKDNLRNPLLIHAKLTVPASDPIKTKQAHWQLLCIPVAPPQDCLIANTGIDYPDISMVSTVLQSRQAAILRMFRHWRGETTYHLNFYPTSSTTPVAPIYVAYLPANGQWTRGVRTRYNVLDGNPDNSFLTNSSWDLCGTGIPFDTVYPNINPAPSYSIPFTHPNNWCVINERGLDTNMHWRDRTDWNNGHLLIYTRFEGWRVDVLWEAGDSFTLADYIGVPPMTMPTPITLTDAHPTEQMEGGGEDLQPSGFNGMLHSFKRMGVAATEIALKHTGMIARGSALAAVSTVSPTLATSIGTAMFLEKAEHGLNSLQKTGESIGTAALRTSQAAVGALDSTSQAASTLSSLPGTLATQLNTFIISVTNATGKAVSVIKDLLIDLLISLQAQDWKVTCLCILRFFTNIGLVTIDAALSAGEQLYQIIWRALGLNPVQQLEGNLDALDDGDKANLIGILITLVCTTFKTTITAPPGKLFSSLFSTLTELKTLSFANQAIRLCQALFGTIQKLIQWIIRKINPAAGALELYSGKKELIDEFIKNANFVMNPVNNALKSTPLYRIRAWLAFIEAQRIRTILITTNHKGGSPALGTFVNKYLTWLDSNFAALRASPVRYEPFVIRIGGPSAIGKSFMIHQLIPDLLTACNINIPGGEAIWTRTSGNPYWNSVGDQPVILYDDWMQSRDASLMAMECAELFALKSTAVFNPTKARLEEKDDRINPYIVVLLCNNSFPDGPVSSLEALWRRADLAVEVSLADGHDGPVRNDPHFSHMQFQLYEDPGNRNSLRPLTFNYDQFQTLATRTFRAYHHNERENVARRLDRIRELAVGDHALQDPFSFLYDAEAIVAGDENLRGPNAASPQEILAARVLAHRLAEVEHAIRPPPPPVFNVLPDPRVPVAQAEGTPPVMDEIMIHFNALTAAASSQALVDYIIEHKLNNWLSHPAPISIPGDHTCLVCQNDEVTRVTMCTQCGQGVCAHCHYASQFVEDYDQHTCPQCRGTDIAIVMRAEDFMRLTIIQKCWNFGITGLAHLARLGLYGHYAAHGFLMMMKLSDAGVPLLSIPCFGLVGVVSRGLYRRAWNECPVFFQSIQEIKTYFLTLPSRVKNAIIALLPEKLRNWTPFNAPLFQADDNDDDGDDDEFLDSASDEADQGYLAVERERAFERLVAASVNRYRAGLFPDDSFEQFVPQSLAVHTDAIAHFSGNHCGTCVHQTKWTPAATYWDGRYTVIDNHGVAFHIPDQLCTLSTNTYPECKWKDYGAWLADMRQYAAYNARYIAHHRAQSPESQERHLPKLFWKVEHAPDLGQDAIATATWWDQLPEVPQVIKDAIPYLTAAVGVFVAYKGLQKIMSTFFGNPVEQIISSGDNTTSRPPARSGVAFRRSFNATRAVAAATAAPPTSQMDEGLMTAVRTKLLCNTRVVSYTVGNKKRNFLVLGVKGGFFIFLNHYLDALDKLTPAERKEVTIAPWLQPFATQKLNIVFNERNCVRSEIRDFAVCDLTGVISPVADITKYMRTEVDADKVLPARGEFMDLAHSGQNTSGTQVAIRDVQINGRVPEIAVSTTVGLLTRADSISYNYERDGACGCVLVDPRANKPILAIHYAGYSGRKKGLGIPLIKEDFDDAFEILKAAPVERDPLPTFQLKELEETSTYFPEDVRVTYVTGVKHEFVPHMSSKTTIKKSSVSALLPWKPVTEPAILSKRDPRYNPEFTLSPLVAGVAKHGRTWAPIGPRLQEIMDEDQGYMIAKFRPVIAKPQLPTWEEAAVGLPGVKGYEPLKLDTSAGWPWTQMSKDKSKRWLIEYKRDAQEMPIGATMNEVLANKLEEGWKRRLEGFAQPSVFMNFLKDERRKVTKARSLGGTRIICGSPIELTLTSRRVFMHYNAAFKNNCIFGSHAVGINPYSSDWDLLANYLLEVGNNIIAIDYSDFGPSISTDLVKANILSKCNWLTVHCPDMFTGETPLRWRNLFECLSVENAFAYQICNDVIIEPQGGAPSGKDATAEDNSDFNRKLLRVAWLALTGKNMAECSAHTRIVVYGDDVLISVSDTYKEIFNANTLCQAFAEMGIKCSDESKQSVFPDYRRLDEVSFLKNNFVFNHEIQKWVAAMDEKAALEVCHWIRKSPDDGAATVSNCEETMRFLWGYGRPKFNETLCTINQALLDAELQPLQISWDSVKNEFFPGLLQ